MLHTDETLYSLCCMNRFEVYCGKKQRLIEIDSIDTKSGPAVVVCNLKAVFGPTGYSVGFDTRPMRLIITDRFYTSVVLAPELLDMGFYSVGRMMTNRIGYCKEVVEKRKTRSKDTRRGSFKIARHTSVPGMKAITWWDSKPVRSLCVGGSTELDRVVCREYSEQTEVPCPRVVKDYHDYMRGVNIHDQLRLQRYSM